MQRGRRLAARLLVPIFVGAVVPGWGSSALDQPQPGMPLGQAVFLESLVEVGEPVKGAPYSAKASTEVVKSLVDGNRVVWQASGSVYRDSRGWVRREQVVSVGLVVTTGEPPRTISISDPDSRTTYILDPARRVAQRERAPGAPPGVSSGPNLNAIPSIGSRADGAQSANAPIRRTESLGTREIEGVTAQGTRTMITIPAGAVGNERAIESVNERWLSPDLQVVVLSHRVDPVFGDITYRLTAIRRDEPAAALFRVPPDYRVIDQSERPR